MLQAEAAEFVKDLLLEIDDISVVEVVIAPPFTAIAKMNEALGKAQNIKLGRKHALGAKRRFYRRNQRQRCCAIFSSVTSVIGHSERRAMFGET